MSVHLLPTSELYHYGKGHLNGGHSGRYPWGSGKKWSTKSVRKKTDLRKEKEKKEKSTGKNLSNNKELSTHYLTRHRIKNMTDQEIASKIDRLKKERELVSLSRDIEQHGEGVVRKALKTVGQKTLETALTGGALYLLNAAGEGKFDAHDLLKSMSRGQISGGKGNKEKKKKENKIGFE